MAYTVVRRRGVSARFGGRVCGVVAAALLAGGLAGSARGDVVYGTPDAVYTQDFNTLATSGHTNPWNDDVTIPGWFANETAYAANNASIHGNELEAYGNTGSGDRALGAYPASNPAVRFGVRFTNDTGQVLTQFTLGYDGEQWLDQASSGGPDRLVFTYLIGSSPAITDAGFVAVPGLDFVAPHDNPTARVELDGNDPANRVHIADTVTGLTWNPGEELFLRWTNGRQFPGSPIDEAIGIDDLAFSAAVPEPASLALLAVGGAALAARRRRAR